MAVIEFVGQSRRDSDNTQAEPSRLVNYYREPASGDRTRHILKSVLGTVAFADLNTVFMRDMVEVEGTIYAVAGGQLYSLNANGVATSLGNVTDSEETTISGNNGNVCVTAGGDYYVWDGTTLSQSTDGAFSSYGSAFFLGQRTFLTEKNGRRVQWSGVAAPETLDALDFATTETRDDKNIRGIAISGDAWLFKQSSIEIWGLSGATDVVAPLNTLDIGLKSFGLLSSFPNGAVFVGSDGVVYVTSGGGIQPISITAVETAIDQSEGVRCFYYEDEGHKFCCIRFRDRPAWCYDLSTGEWHERAEGVRHENWPAVAAVKAFGSWHIGTDFGAINRMARVNADVDSPLLRRAVSRTLWQDSQRLRVAEFEIYGQMGGTSYLGYEPVYLSAGGLNYMDAGGGYILQAGTRASEIDIMCWLRVSRDYGKTWGQEKFKSLGKLGEYNTRAVWRGLGQSRFFVFELNCAAPVDIPIFCDARVRVA